MTPGVDWPSGEEAERWEIHGFIDHYRRLPGRRAFDVVRRQERPDWVVRDIATGELIGVELTSVYRDDRSVPDWHKRSGSQGISYRRKEIDVYGQRVAAAVGKKVRLARSGYDSTLPLVLSIYANEYVTVHMGEKEWQAVVRAHEETFDSMRPFTEVIVWPLVNGGVLRIRPSS